MSENGFTAPTPRLILAVTSATAAVGVAIVEAADDGLLVLAEQLVVTDRRHAEELTPMIAAALATASAGRPTPIRLGDIDRFAVNVGPGRFTGLRVGLATVRTLALATATPVTGISGLEALAAAEAMVGAETDTLPDGEARSEAATMVTAIIDARRAEVFQQRFSVTGTGVATPLGPPLVGRPGDFVSHIGADDVVVGDGADRYAELYGERLRPGREPSPTVIARLAATRPGLPGPEVAPLYLREPDVQINIKTRRS